MRCEMTWCLSTVKLEKKSFYKIETMRKQIKLKNNFRYEKSLFKLWVCNSLYVMLTQPEDIEFVLKNPKLQKKSKEYLVLQESIMGQGIFSINDIHKWKKNRYVICYRPLRTWGNLQDKKNKMFKEHTLKRKGVHPSKPRVVTTIKQEKTQQLRTNKVPLIK